MKSEQIIHDILQQGEGVQLEFKATLNREAIARTVCGFLNAEGGQVLIGVKDDKVVTGLNNIQNASTELERYLVTSIVPAASIMVSIEEFEGKSLLLVEVWGGTRQPYIYNGSIYYRRGEHTVKATSAEISGLIHKRQSDEMHWERQSVPTMDLLDLDQQEILRGIREINKSGRGSLFAEDDMEGFLNAQNLYQNGILSNAAVILFGKKPTKFLPQCRVRLTVFKTSKISDEFYYDLILEDNLFAIIEKITNFFDVNVATKSRFKDEDWKRTDISFPRMALREGLLNALIHRDYSNFSSSALIAFYPDRLEMSNYGGLPGDLKLADLKVNHLSLPRNPDIAQVCFLRGWIDKIGRGTLKIMQDCKDKGLEAPSWHTGGGATTLVYPGVTVTRYSSNADSEGDNDGDSDGVNEVLDKDLNDGVSEGVIDGVTDGVKEELKKLIRLVVHKPGLNTTSIAKTIGKSVPTVERYISILRSTGTIERKGVSRTAGYHPSGRTMRKLSRKKQ